MMTMRRRDPLTSAQEARFSWPDYPLNRAIRQQEYAAKCSAQSRDRIGPILKGLTDATVCELTRMIQRDDAVQYRKARDAYDLWRSTLRGQRVPSQEPTQ